MKKSFTTTEIADLFGVDKTSVAKWIDKGDIVAFRTPGGHRRVFANDLRIMMKKYKINIPLPGEIKHASQSG